MKSLIRSVARLYPPRWRDRYGIEFDALLADGESDWRDLFDVLKGALAMRLRDVGLITAGFAILGALVAGVVSLKIPEQYASTAVLHLEGTRVGNADANADSIRKLIHTSLSQESLSAVIKNETLYDYKGDRDVRSVDGLINRLRLAIRFDLVRPGPNSSETAFRITFVDQDRARAQRVVASLIDLMMKVNVAQPAASAARLYTFEPPSLAASPTSPSRRLITGLGCAVGLVIGTIATWLRRAARPRTA